MTFKSFCKSAPLPKATIQKINYRPSQVSLTAVTYAGKSISMHTKDSSGGKYAVHSGRHDGLGQPASGKQAHE